MTFLNNVIEEIIRLFEQLRPIYQLRDGPINPIQTEILNYLVSYPESTAYSICRDHSWVMQSPIIRSKNVNDRTLRRDIAALERKGFIQRFQKGKYEHKAQPSRLTLSGIVFLVLKKRLMHGKTFCKVFENYGNNTLFRFFSIHISSKRHFSG